MRARETIDGELRLLATVRRTIRDDGGPMPTTARMGELLDERPAHHGRASKDAAGDTERRLRSLVTRRNGEGV